MFGDFFDFHKFQLGDWAKKIKKNPEQLLLGAADPFGAKVWGGVLGKKYEPMVDQMGGPYGGSPISAFGSGNGGVYGRAEAAGINTKPARFMEDAAHAVAGSYAGGYGLDKLGGLFGGMSGGQFGGGQIGQFGGGMMPQMPQQQPQQNQQQDQAEQMRREQEMRRMLAMIEMMRRGGGNAAY